MKRTTKLSLLALLVMVCLVATVALVACKGNDGGFALDKTEVTVAEGSSATVRVDKNETGESVDWTVDKSDVVQIVTKNNNLCYIKGLKAGSAVLTAKAGEATATVNVTVTASNVDTITITKDGNAVNAAEVVRGQTITLVATSSKGNTITWESDDETIATVDGGVVTGVAPGMTNITAKTSGGQKSVAVTVNAAQDDDYYEITLNGGESDANANPGKWTYWTQNASISTINYYNGKVTLEFTGNAGAWYNMQLFNINPDVKKGTYYKLSVDIDSNTTGHVTINNYDFELKTGKHTYEIYFNDFNGFKMQFGVQGANPAIDIVDAKVAISNLHYEEDTNRETLKTPSFTYNSDTGVISITDENTAGVKNYVLNLYQNDTLITGVVVENGDVIDWSMVLSGTYLAKV